MDFSVISPRTCVLKVYIHCQGCEKKVHKVLKKINGVSSISIDSENNKVTVSGAIDQYTLLKALAKAGKKAEILWDSSVSVSKNPTNQNRCMGQCKILTDDFGTKNTNFAGGVSGGGPGRCHGQAPGLKYYGRGGNTALPPSNGYNHWAGGDAQSRPSAPPFPSQPYSKPSIFSDENPSGCRVM